MAAQRTLDLRRIRVEGLMICTLKERLRLDLKVRRGKRLTTAVATTGLTAGYVGQTVGLTELPGVLDNVEGQKIT